MLRFRINFCLHLLAGSVGEFLVFREEVGERTTGESSPREFFWALS
jgi:hypothetical protein